MHFICQYGLVIKMNEKWFNNCINFWNSLFINNKTGVWCPIIYLFSYLGLFYCTFGKFLLFCNIISGKVSFNIIACWLFPEFKGFDVLISYSSFYLTSKICSTCLFSSLFSIYFFAFANHLHLKGTGKSKNIPKNPIIIVWLIS